MWQLSNTLIYDPSAGLAYRVLSKFCDSALDYRIGITSAHDSAAESFVLCIDEKDEAIELWTRLQMACFDHKVANRPWPSLIQVVSQARAQERAEEEEANQEAYVVRCDCGKEVYANGLCTDCLLENQP